MIRVVVAGIKSVVNKQLLSRGLVLVVTILSALAPWRASEAGLNAWTSGGLEGGQIRTLAIDPRTANVLYAGSGAGVFKSTSGGEF